MNVRETSASLQGTRGGRIPSQLSVFTRRIRAYSRLQVVDYLEVLRSPRFRSGHNRTSSAIFRRRPSAHDCKV